MKHSFLKEEIIDLRHQVTFTGNEMRIYIPKNYLEKNSIFAVTLGNRIQTVGLFWFEVDKKKYELTLPVKIEFTYSYEDTQFKGKLMPYLPSIEYKVYVLKSGDAFCYDTSHVNRISDLELVLLRIIEQGKLPPIVGYSESITILLKLLVSAGVNTKLNVASSILEMLLSNLYRNKHDISEPFRLLLNSKSNVTDYDYKMVKLTAVPQLNSTFNSLMGEDTYSQLANCVVRNREKKKDRISPMEKLLKL